MATRSRSATEATTSAEPIDLGADPVTVVVLDLDGVVSPVHGRTTWGDDIVVSPLFGGMRISPAMCDRLEQLARQPSVTCGWLTSWGTQMRAALGDPFPGQRWTTIGDPLEWATTAPQVAGHDWDSFPWWKWWALKVWLEHHEQIGTIIWCDDHLSHKAPGRANATYASLAQAWFRRHGQPALLICPQTARGLTASHLDQIEAASRARGRT